MSNIVSAAPSVLDPYRWHNRLLMIFTPNLENSELKSLLSQVKQDQCAFKERDLVMGLIVRNGTSQIGDTALSPTSTKDIRQFFSVEEREFSTILIGKDGYEKLRFTRAPNLKQVFSTIDQMPMRRQEMLHAQSPCEAN